MAAAARARVAAWLVVWWGSVAGCSPHGGDDAAPQYPATRTVDAVGDYHGTKVADPYRWLESLDSPEVGEWAAAQTALALSHVRATEAGTQLLARMESLDGFWREPRDEPSEDPSDGPPAGPPEPRAAPVSPRVDPTSLVPADRLQGLDGNAMFWTQDRRGFFYGRITQPAQGDGSNSAERAVYYHVSGTPQSRDVPVLRLGAEAPDVNVEFELSEDGRFLIAAEGTGPYVDELGHLNTRLHLLDLRDPARPTIGGAPFALSASTDAAYRVVTTRGDSLFVLTDRAAPRRRLVVFAAGTPGAEHWRDVIPESDDVIDQVQEIGDHFVVRYLRDVQHGVRVYERDGRLVRELPIRPMTTILDIRQAAAGALVVEAIEGFVPTRRRYDLVAGRDSAEQDVKVPSPADPYEIRQVWYSSKDGVRVPMFLAHRRGLPLDGSHPTLMGGYGASSSIEMPQFGPAAVALLELGFVLAAPSLRGGGEFGRDWYEAAMLGRKQTTFDDFIAAAEFLIQERYTAADRLAIFGSSNGGMLVASVITQRPDLFRVAVAQVPPTDLLRFDPGTHRAQYGSPENPAHVPFLLASSALHQVRPRTCYPSTLITTSFDDDVIPAWNAFKFAAALQAAQSCGRPVLLRADTTGGHGRGGPAGASDMFGFIIAQLGMSRPEGPPP